jgi:hypothetical protein
MNSAYRRVVAGTRLVQQIFGSGAERRIRPVVAITFTYAVFSTFWIYVGVFAVKGSGPPPKTSASSSSSRLRRPRSPAVSPIGSAAAA